MAGPQKAVETAPPPTATEEQLPLVRLPEALEREDERDFEELLKRPAMLRDLTLDTLSQLPTESVNQILASRARVVQQRRAVAIAMTKPMDWVLFKDRDGNIVGLLAETGAAKVAEWLGISVYNHRTLDGKVIAGIPKLREIPDGQKTIYIAEGLCDVKDRERTIEGVPYFRRSDEHFTGREGRKDDLLASWRTGIDCKAIGKLTGLRKVSGEELEANGIKLDKCRKGAGYGTSADRTAGKVSDAGVRQLANALRDDMLRAAGGKMEDAKSILRDCSKYNAFKGTDGGHVPASPGLDSWDQIATEAKLQKILARWKKHPLYVEANQPAAADPADDPQMQA